MSKQKSSQKIENKIDEGLCDLDIFNCALKHFDPTIQLFKKWNELKQSYFKLKRYMDSERDNLSGLRLIGF